MAFSRRLRAGFPLISRRPLCIRLRHRLPLEPWLPSPALCFCIGIGAFVSGLAQFPWAFFFLFYFFVSFLLPPPYLILFAPFDMPMVGSASGALPLFRSLLFSVCLSLRSVWPL